MYFLDEPRLMRENPWHYCSAWLPGQIHATMRARRTPIGTFMYDPDKAIKKTIRTEIIRQLFPPNTHPIPPRGEVVVRLVSFHAPLKRYKIPEGLQVSHDLMVGVTWRGSQDVDNIAKIYMDALNPRRGNEKRSALEGVLWEDDSQVFHLDIAKLVWLQTAACPGILLEAWFRTEPMIETIARHLKGRHYERSEYFRREPQFADRACTQSRSLAAFTPQ